MPIVNDILRSFVSLADDDDEYTAAAKAALKIAGLEGFIKHLCDEVPWVMTGHQCEPCSAVLADIKKGQSYVDPSSV